MEPFLSFDLSQANTPYNSDNGVDADAAAAAAVVGHNNSDADDADSPICVSEVDDK